MPWLQLIVVVIGIVIGIANILKHSGQILIYFTLISISIFLLMIFRNIDFRERISPEKSESISGVMAKCLLSKENLGFSRYVGDVYGNNWKINPLSRDSWLRNFETR